MAYSVTVMSHTSVKLQSMKLSGTSSTSAILARHRTESGGKAMKAYDIATEKLCNSITPSLLAARYVILAVAINFHGKLLAADKLLIASALQVSCQLQHLY